MNSLEVARKHVKQAYEYHDQVFVMVNGSLDSLAVLGLCLEHVGARRVKAVYRDPELVDQFTLTYLRRYIAEDLDIDFEWVTTRFKSNVYALGIQTPYVQWDDSRERYRSPETKILTEHLLDVNSFYRVFGRPYRGKIAFMTGVKAVDSVSRQRTRHHIFCRVKNGPRYFTVRPIMDWTSADVCQYLDYIRLEPNPVYREFAKYGVTGTISEPLAHRASKVANAAANVDPDLMVYIANHWPAYGIEALYPREVSSTDYVRRFAGDPMDIRRWIVENLPSRDHRAAIRQLGKAMTLHNKKPDEYPLHYIMRYFMRGAWRYGLKPIAKRRNDGDQATGAA